MTYNALARAAQALGYSEAWTYTLPGEDGRSVKAAGFVDRGLTDGGEIAYVRDPTYMRMRQYEGFIKPLIRKMPVVRRSWKLTKAAGWLLRRYVDHRVKGLAMEYERQRTAHRRMLGVK